MIPTILEECSWFLTESDGKPLLKSLPRNSDGYRRVKVRKKKKKENFDEVFNNSFFMDYNDLRSRALFVNGTQIEDDDHELFYVFPIDGYNFIYNETVFNSTGAYRNLFDTLIETAGDTNGMDIFKEMLNISYSYSDLPKAIDSGCEIIIYDISHYYAIRKTIVDNYTDWFKLPT